MTIPGGIQGISNTTVLAMINSLNSTLDVVRHANRETGTLATEIRGNMQVHSHARAACSWQAPPYPCRSVPLTLFDVSCARLSPPRAAGRCAGRE